MRHRCAVAAVLALLIATAGCGGAPSATPTTATEPTRTPTTASEPTRTPTTTTEPTETPTPSPPSGSIDFPEGPKERPERPPTLNESSVRGYVGNYEYRIAYNSLWLNESSTVTLACRVDSVTERPWGYAAVVTCTGSSETDGLNGDWFTQSYRYRVSETALDRTQIEPRDPVS